MKVDNYPRRKQNSSRKIGGENYAMWRVVLDNFRGAQFLVPCAGFSSVFYGEKQDLQQRMR
jgi:hypothetical protein